MSGLVLALAGSFVLAGVHLFTPVLERAPARYRSSLASLGGGAGLAYVFLYLLFELATEGAPKIHELAPIGPDPLETLFLLLLAAFSLTYVAHARFQRTADLRDDHGGFVLLFATYNILAGAGLVEEARWGLLNLAFYVTALGLHLLFNDRFLLHLAPGVHTWRWRATLAAAPVVGVGLATGLDLSLGALYMILAVVAGGTIINVLRYELPDPQRFRPGAFLAGVAGYSALILATWRF